MNASWHLRKSNSAKELKAEAGAALLYQSIGQSAFMEHGEDINARHHNFMYHVIHELAAGKLTALLERQTGRDFFDANELFQYPKIDKNKLRLVFVLYAAMCSKKDMLNLKLDDITANYTDVKNKLIPVMKNNFYDGFTSTEDWMNNMINNVRRGFKILLPFTLSKEAFIRSVVNGIGVKPELLITTTHLIDFSVIKNHPALLWAKMSSHRFITC